VSLEKELFEVQANADYPPAGARRPASSLGGRSPSQLNATAASYSTQSFFDTQTPIVVHAPPSLPQRYPSSTSTTGSRSTSRDNVRPGEDILFDGPVKSSQTLKDSDFQHGQLKIFRNTITQDLRFHCKTGNDSETYWLKANKAQLIPVYAYDQRYTNVVYIRDTDVDKGSSSNGGGGGGQMNGTRMSGIYKFDLVKDLFDFQAKLTSEKVVLDITSVKLVRLSKANSRSSDTYSGVRLQIWHEAELRRSTQSDVSSFVTAGTALSGPLRERLVANLSRLVIYLGRLGEYIHVFITDDIDLKPEGQTSVKLKARKAGAFTKKGSRWPGVKARIEKKRDSDELAGLDIHGQAPDTDIESTFDLYKTFEIEFETSPSQDNFIRKWDEVMRERRAQRTRLKEISEGMEQNTYGGKTAIRVLM